MGFGPCESHRTTRLGSKINSTVLNEFFTANPAWSAGLSILGIHFDTFPEVQGQLTVTVDSDSEMEDDPSGNRGSKYNCHQSPEERFDLSPSLKLLQLEELYLHAPQNECDSESASPYHFLQNQRNLKRLYINFHNIFTRNANRDNIKAFVGKLETLHLLDNGRNSLELPCEVILTVLSFCRKTIKDISIRYGTIFRLRG